MKFLLCCSKMFYIKSKSTQNRVLLLIKLNIFIDTPSIVLDSLKDRFILMFSFVQIILACIYFIYTYLENEREELNKTRNLFINAMAHEMKTPNAVILNSSEMLIENVNPEKQHKYLKMIEDESSI